MKTPDLQAIRATAARLAPHVVRTPSVQLSSARVADAIGSNVFLKLELFQRTGTFKYRAALNNLLNTDFTPGQGVTAVSAGNHAVAVSCAAASAGVDAKVVMLGSANPARRALAASFGAELHFVDSGAEAFAMAEAFARDENRIMVHPFDGERVAEATGCVGMEFLDDVKDLEAVVIAVGGGGLAGGMANAIKLLAPQCKVYGVEPEGADGMCQSIAAGKALSGLTVSTIADSLGPPLTTDMTVTLCSRNIDALVTVSDDAMCDAMTVLFDDAKLAVEPAGAAALAAAIGPLRDRLEGKRTGLLVCGSCIDQAGFMAMLERGHNV